jgi:type II secretory pathway component PulF
MFRWIRNILLGILLGFAGVVIMVWILGGGSPIFSENVFDTLAALIFVFSAFAMLVWLVLFIGQSGGVQQRRRATTILSYLEQAIRMNLPLPQMLIAAEASESRSIARNIRQVRRQLDSGVTIADALGNAVPVTSRRTLALIDASERVGRVGSELDRLVKEQTTRQSRDALDQSFLATYPVIMTMVIVFILAMIMIFVMPKFSQIFRDFQLPLPPLTLMVIQISGFGVDQNSGGSWWLFAVVAIVVMAIASQFRWMFAKQLRRLGWSPLAGIARNRHLADICHVIANALTAGLPLDSAIRSAGDLPIGALLRSRVHKWSAGIERGMTPGQAAHAAQMPRLIAELMPTAEISAAAPVFAFLERYYAARFSRLLILLRGAAVPAMVFVFGVIVAVIALALFLPLISLIGFPPPSLL